MHIHNHKWSFLRWSFDGEIKGERWRYTIWICDLCGKQKEQKMRVD